jgi:DNA invertase Pin-like site-specific DNA recombinase
MPSITLDISSESMMTRLMSALDTLGINTNEPVVQEPGVQHPFATEYDLSKLPSIKNHSVDSNNVIVAVCVNNNKWYSLCDLWTNLMDDYVQKHSSIKNVFCFARVSTKNQTGVDHISTEVQNKTMTDYLPQITGVKYVRRYNIVRSAFSKLPRELLAIRDIAKDGDVLLCHRIDRISRNIYDVEFFLKLHNAGITIISASENVLYTGKRDPDFPTKVLAGTLESISIGARVRASLDLLREKGHHIGGVAWNKLALKNENGIRKVVDNPYSLETSNQINGLLARGVAPSEIADHMNVRGRPRGRHRWSERSVCRTFNVQPHRARKLTKVLKLTGVETIALLLNIQTLKSRYVLRSQSINYSPRALNVILARGVTSGRFIQVRDSFKLRSY